MKNTLFQEVKLDRNSRIHEQKGDLEGKDEDRQKSEKKIIVWLVFFSLFCFPCFRAFFGEFMFTSKRYEPECNVFKNCWHSIQHDLVFSEALWLIRLAKAVCSLLSKLSWGIMIVFVLAIVSFFANAYFRYLITWEEPYSVQVIFLSYLLLLLSIFHFPFSFFFFPFKQKVVVRYSVRCLGNK